MRTGQVSMAAMCMNSSSASSFAQASHPLSRSCLHRQLPAPRRNVGAAALADGAGDVVFREDGLEAFGGWVGCGKTVVIGNRVERDQVDVRRHPAQERAQYGGLLFGVVLPFDKCPFKEDPPLHFLRVIAAGGHKLIEWPGSRGRDEL